MWIKQDKGFLPRQQLSATSQPCPAASLLQGVHPSSALHMRKEQLPELTDGLLLTSGGIVSLINQLSMFCSMNYLSDLHFVSEGWLWGLAGREDHNDEDGDQEESEDCAHHSSGHSDGVWPLLLRLVCDRETFSLPQNAETSTWEHKKRPVVNKMKLGMFRFYVNTQMYQSIKVILLTKTHCTFQLSAT